MLMQNPLTTWLLKGNGMVSLLFYWKDFIIVPNDKKICFALLGCSFIILCLLLKHFTAILGEYCWTFIIF